MPIPRYDVKSLPKWARREIKTLEMRLREARERIAELTAEGPTNIAINPRMDGDADNWAPDDARVQFTLDDADPWKKWIDVRIEDGQLLLISSDTLTIQPRSTNIAVIGVV